MVDALELVKVKAPSKNKDRRGWRFFVKDWPIPSANHTLVAERYGRDGSVVGAIVHGPGPLGHFSGPASTGMLRYVRGQLLPASGRVYSISRHSFEIACINCTITIDAELGDE